MIATYLTIFVVSTLDADSDQHMAYAYKDRWDCSEALGANAQALHEARLMGRCILTNIITSTSTPMERPDNLMEAYTNDD